MYGTVQPLQLLQPLYNQHNVWYNNNNYYNHYTISTMYGTTITTTTISIMYGTTFTTTTTTIQSA